MEVIKINWNVNKRPATVNFALSGTQQKGSPGTSRLWKWLLIGRLHRQSHSTCAGTLVCNCLAREWCYVQGGSGQFRLLITSIIALLPTSFCQTDVAHGQHLNNSKLSPWNLSPFGLLSAATSDEAFGDISAPSSVHAFDSQILDRIEFH
jgi:hypothetical protein